MPATIEVSLIRLACLHICTMLIPASEAVSSHSGYASKSAGSGAGKPAMQAASQAGVQRLAPGAAASGGACSMGD